MMFSIQCFGVLLCLSFLEAIHFRCDYKFDEIGWFKYHALPAEWSDARSMCHDEGAILASPTTTTIKAKMMQLVNGSDIFIGMHSTFSKGHFHSIDGIPISQIPQDWAQYEPNNLNNAESCLTLNKEGKMADVACNLVLPYICYRVKSDVEATVCGTPDSEYHFHNRTNKCYKFNTSLKTFQRAHFTCSAEGGHLAIINSDEEAQVLGDVYARQPNTHTLRNAYVGAYSEQGTFRTVHGQLLREAGYDKFAEGEPNNAGGVEDCIIINRAATLNDVSCASTFPFICEKDPKFPPVCNSIAMLTVGGPINK